MKIKAEKEQSLITFLQDQLDRLPEIRAKRMFGGIGLYSGELFFAIIGDGKLYFKTDDTTKARYEALQLPAFQPGEHIKPFKYHLVPVEIIEDAQELTVWAKEAFDVSRQAAEKTNAKSKRK